MRRLISILSAAVVLAGTVSPVLADASQPCMRTAEKTAFDLASLKSELMVIAIDCQAEERYNAFVMRFRPDLQGSEKGLNTYFSRTARGGSAHAHDDYITSLANSQSQDALTRGTLFCQEHVAMFDEVLALKGSQDLVGYASGKGLVQPIDVVECPAAAPPRAKKARVVPVKASGAKPLPTKTVASQ